MAKDKKTDSTPAKKKVPVNQPKSGGLKEYFKGVKTETKKVVWPTRKELTSYTIVVLVACVFFGLVIWGLDSAFLAALRELLKINI
ncbi:MAG: preprotein translocase subunit SecE [Clostridiales Family XIII bacterium]|nr:preprotein translocase subunit SecE [Clostridiales Family XIII bacterium]